MAFVDFTNAVLHLPTDTSYNVTTIGYASLYNGQLFNASRVSIADNYSCSLLEDSSNKLLLVYTGTFNTSGTEFYLGGRSAIIQKYKMTGISFQAGDTYSFQIPITLTCL